MTVVQNVKLTLSRELGEKLWIFSSASVLQYMRRPGSEMVNARCGLPCRLLLISSRWTSRREHRRTVLGWIA